MRKLIVLLAGIFILPWVMAAANFDVNSFSCTPSEVVVGNVFSCTAQIKNNGDASGSVSVATLYPDGNNWLEDSSYPQVSGESVSPGQTAEVTFTGLKATKTGSMGFSKIMLDDVTDTYVVDQNVEVNVIGVVVTVESSESSVAMSGSFDLTAEVVAGGNVDVSLRFVSNSGGCSIGEQTNPKSISGMQDGNTQSRVWSVTQGTSGDCSYTISATATGSGEIASKTDSVSGSVDCSDCPTSSSSSSSGGGGGGGSGGGDAVTSKNFGEFAGTKEVEISAGENVKFMFGGINHSLSVVNVSDSYAMIIVKSEEQSFNLSVGEEVEVDLTGDGLKEILIKLKSINLLTKKAKFSLTMLRSASAGEKERGDEEGVDVKEEDSSLGGRSYFRVFVILIILIIVVGVVWYFLKGKG